jgi:hypothetical protein
MLKSRGSEEEKGVYLPITVSHQCNLRSPGFLIFWLGLSRKK